MEDSGEEARDPPMSLYRQMQRVSQLGNLERAARARRGERWRNVVDHDVMDEEVSLFSFSSLIS